jgi:hypothetical protein
MKKHVILFLAASPRTSDPLRLAEECAEIQRELKMSPHRDDFQFESRWAVSVDELMRHLNELAPAVIHFSGHGGDNSGLLLQDEQGRPQPVSGRAFAMMIDAAARDARAVVLNACSTTALAELLRAKVECVVGMDGAIGDDAARAFAIRFYGALGNRRSIGNALDQGVAALAAKQLPDEVMPRCLTRDGVDPYEVVLPDPTRLRELLCTDGASSRIADHSGYSGSRSPAMRSPDAAAPRRLDLVDVSFDDIEVRHKSSSCPALDLKMVNRSTSTIFVKRTDLHIQAIWRLPPYNPLTISLGRLDCSASYDLMIPDRAPPFVLSQQMSHVLKPDEAERFRIVLHRPASGYAVLSMIAKVVHGSEGFEESSGELLCVFWDYDKLGCWDPDAYRICVQIASKIRERTGHMSKRLLQLLEDIESGRRLWEPPPRWRAPPG